MATVCSAPNTLGWRCISRYRATPQAPFSLLLEE